MPAELTTAESYRQDLVDTGIVIRTEALVKTYEMGAEQVHALQGVDLEIHKGEYVAIMGPSGFKPLIFCPERRRCITSNCR